MNKINEYKNLERAIDRFYDLIAAREGIKEARTEKMTFKFSDLKIYDIDRHGNITFKITTTYPENITIELFSLALRDNSEGILDSLERHAQELLPEKVENALQAANEIFSEISANVVPEIKNSDNRFEMMDLKDK